MFLVLGGSGRLFGSKWEGLGFAPKQKNNNKNVVVCVLLKISDLENLKNLCLLYDSVDAMVRIIKNEINSFLVADLQKDIWKQAGGGRVSQVPERPKQQFVCMIL